MTKLRIIVLDHIVRLPIGGMAWHHLQYLMGLAAMGHDVYSFGDSNDYEWSCYDPTRHVSDKDPQYGLSFAADLFGKTGLGERWTYYDAHTATWYGPAAGRAGELCASADVLLNLGPVNPVRPWHSEIPIRILVDTDPVFTQIDHLTDRAAMARAMQHTAFFSFGENIESGRSSVPDDGLNWQATRQPVAIDAWPVTPGPADAPYTTVMQWDSYPAREYAGQRYEMKSESFKKYLDLPKSTGPVLEVAMGSANAPRERLREQGWRLRDPFEASRDAWVYQDYIQRSKGEFTVAKQAYVASRSGWFSERSAVYLAAGRPVITEETGFSERVPAGAGVLSFSDYEGALGSIREVTGRYQFHCKAAREIAAGFFDSRRVLSSLIERAFAVSAAGERVEACK